MSWEIIAGLITIVAFLITEGSVIVKLSSTITKLQASIDLLDKILEELKGVNSEDHKQFNKTLFNHEGRIHEIEAFIKNH